MKFSIFSLLFGFLAAFALAAAPQNAVIISYPDDTPDSVLEDAMRTIKGAGGTITHRYRLIKAFSARVSQSNLEKVSALNDKWKAVIEEDKPVSIADSSS